MSAPGVTVQPFGVAAGAPVQLYVLRNRQGMEVRITNYGATVVGVHVPDRAGRYDDVVLGFDALEDYRTHAWYAGATVGRYAGRISNARFSLDGRDYVLSANDGSNHLHGGIRGFDKAIWQARPLDSDLGVRLRHVSPDGEEGYAGTLDAAVSYMLTDANDLIVDYHATTDRPTPINLTHHSYFNLAGRGDILGHELSINAETFLPVDQRMIPTGATLSVEGTPFDFREPVAIGARIGERDPQLRIAGGYDHDFVISEAGVTLMGARKAARVYEPVHGRVLEIFTTEPALHFYSGNFISGTPAGKGKVAYGPHSGFALEPQHFPDSPNQPQFPSTILRPGEQYRARNIYRFSAVAR